MILKKPALRAAQAGRAPAENTATLLLLLWTATFWSRLRHRRLLRLFSLLGRAALLEHAQSGDVLLMLLIRFGEDVPARSIGNEEELPGARRIGSGLKRKSAWIGDRSRRQRVDDIGVVRRRPFEIRL